MFISSRAEDRIFSSAAEFINLFVPVALFIVITIAVFQGIGSLSSLGVTPMHRQILFNTILLGTTHNAFSFACLFFMKEFKPWRNQRLGWQSSVKLKVHLVVFGLFALGSMIFINSSLLGSTSHSAALSEFYILVFLIFTIHHYLMQWKGLSLQYLKSCRLPELLIHREKQIYALLIIPFIGIETANEINFSHFYANYPKPLVAQASFYLATTLCLFLLYNSYRQVKAGASINKFWFSLRVLIIPACYFSPYFFYLLIIWHGVEYFFVFSKLVEGSTVSNNTQHLKRFLLLSFGIFAVVAGLRWGRDSTLISYYQGSLSSTPFSVQALAALSFTVAYSHYILDRMVYQFKNIHSKNLITSLWK